eukprot:12496614-Alexandrium_andersonii.AAC.1
MKANNTAAPAVRVAVWGCLGLPGRSAAVCASLWQSVAVCGCQWLSVTVCGCPWLSVAVCGCQWLSVT